MDDYDGLNLPEEASNVFNEYFGDGPANVTLTEDDADDVSVSSDVMETDNPDEETEPTERNIFDLQSDDESEDEVTLNVYDEVEKKMFENGLRMRIEM
ncbi:hypothetical protein U1Q18_051343 [Sarracenia purpurea var. burkii]